MADFDNNVDDEPVWEEKIEEKVKKPKNLSPKRK